MAGPGRRGADSFLASTAAAAFVSMAAAARHEDSMGDDGEVYHRDNIFEFFRNHTAYDMLPESGKVCFRPQSRSLWACAP